MYQNKNPHVVATKYEEQETKNIKQNDKYLRRIRRLNIKRYKLNSCAILHTDTISPDIIVRTNIVTESNSTGCMNEATVIGDEIIKKKDLVDVSPDTSPENNIPSGTCWLKKVDKYNIGSTTISVKLDIDG